MKKRLSIHYAAAAFALAGAMALCPEPRALASSHIGDVQAGDANVEMKIGDELADGTIFADKRFAARPADARGTYQWDDGKKYCEDLVANGHDDWTLPTDDQLDHLYGNKNAGSFAGTFNETGSSPNGRYWSSTTYLVNRDVARLQYFGFGIRSWEYKEGALARVRCVRNLAP